MGESVLFERYRLLEAIGTGAMARVWHAIDTRTGDEVAVKRLHPIAFGDESSRRRLNREFVALRSLRHPNIVGVRDLELREDDAAIILDYVAGPTLADRMTAGPALTPDEAVAIAADTAAALEYAHRSGVIHRDVKPANIVLGADGRALLVDFGIAHADAAGTAITATNQVTGTFRYMAPEQLRGRPATPASDVFGLAAVTYEMLGGRPPFAGSTPLAVAEAQVTGAPPIGTIPAPLDAAVRGALDLDPAARPPDARSFAEALRDVLDDSPTVAIAPVVGSDEGTSGRAAPPSAARDRRPQAVVIGAAAALLVALVVLAAQPFDPNVDSAIDAVPSASAASAAAPPSATPAPTAEDRPVVPEPAADPEPGNGDDDDDDKSKGKGKGGKGKGGG